MVNMLKVVIAVIVFLSIIGVALLGKKIKRVIIFKTATPLNNESNWLVIITGLIAIGIMISNYINKRPEATWYAWMGILIFFLGGLLHLFARRHLGEQRTLQEAMKEGFTAAQIGLYRKIRHPSKSALLLMFLGLGIALQSTWGTIVLITIFLPALIYRISQEEQKMLDDYGDRWLAYKSETKRLIPGIF